MTTTAPHNQQLGSYGEACAARHLTRSEGMVVLDRNWRCELGELDLVLRDRDVLVVAEVKTRSSERFGSALEGVTADKAERLKVLAACWCEARGLRVANIRIDLVGVLVQRGQVVRIDHSRGIA